MAYRDLVTTTGRFNIPEIMAHAHRKARHEFNAFLIMEAGLSVPANTPLGDVVAETAKLAATVDRSKFKPCFSYATLLGRELSAAWSYARPIRGAGMGDASANVAPMWRAAA